MLFTNSFFSIDFQIDLLVLSQLGDQYIIVKNMNGFNVRMVLTQELDIARVDICILQVLLWIESFGLKLLICKV